MISFKPMLDRSAWKQLRIQEQDSRSSCLRAESGAGWIGTGRLKLGKIGYIMPFLLALQAATSPPQHQNYTIWKRSARKSMTKLTTTSTMTRGISGGSPAMSSTY